MQAKVDIYKGSFEDQNKDRQAMLQEKDQLFQEYVKLKGFIPEFEHMEKSTNKLKFLIDMKQRCQSEDFTNYLY